GTRIGSNWDRADRHVIERLHRSLAPSRRHIQKARFEYVGKIYSSRPSVAAGIEKARPWAWNYSSGITAVRLRTHLGVCDMGWWQSKSIPLREAQQLVAGAGGERPRLLTISANGWPW